MAAPTLRSFPTGCVPGLSTTTHSATAVGDLVVVFTWERGTAGSPTHTLQGDGSTYREIRTHAHDDGSTDGRLSVAAIVATVAGAQAYQAYTTNGSGTVETGCIVIQGGTFRGLASLPTSNSISQTNNGLPNPPSVTGLTGDFLIIAVAGWHLASSVAVVVTAPTNYTEAWEHTGAGGLNLTDIEFSVATRALTNLSNATEDPGTFTDDVAPNGSATMTIAIKGLTTTDRSAAVDATAGIATAGTFFTTFERASITEATADIGASGVAVAGAMTHERATSAAATAETSVTATSFTVFERSAASGASAAVETSGQIAEGITEFERSVAADASGGISTVATFFSTLSRSVGVASNTECDVEGAAWEAHVASVAVSATAGQSAAPQRELMRSLSVTASGEIAASPMRDMPRAAAVVASAAIASSGVRVHDRSCATSAAAATETAYNRVLQRAAIVTAATTPDVSARTIVHIRAATALATGLVISAGLRELIRSSTAGAIGGIISSHQRDLVRSVQSSAAAVIDAAGGTTSVHSRSASISTSGGVASAATFDRIRSVAVVSAATSSVGHMREVQRSCSIRAEAVVQHGAPPGALTSFGHKTDRRMGRGRRITISNP